MLPAPEKKPAPLARPPVILWVGPKHSGKTTSAARLVERARAEGFVVAGCLALSVHENDRLAGFDLINLRSGARTALARRETGPGANSRFHFLAAGLTLGNEALDAAAAADADLIIIDEFGPLELAQEGWRTATDHLMLSTRTVLLLVVREELAAEVQQLYQTAAIRRLVATRPGSIDEVLIMLRNKRR